MALSVIHLRMFVVMRTAIIVTVLLAIICTAAHGQTELGGSNDTPSSTWSLVSVQRTWLPQRNGFPNWGFGAQGFTSIDRDRTFYMGFGIIGSGVGERDVVALVFGPGAFLLGDRTLGLFAYLQGGLLISSQSGMTGFNLFGDVSMQFGAGAVSGIGVCTTITNSVRAQIAVVANAYTVEGGVTPYGLQIGISSGGK
jgi:hypothetical protein